MAVVKSEQFEGFLGRLPKSARLFLLHGTDLDAADERARRLAAALTDDAGGIVRLSAETLSADPGRFADEALAISMFGGRRLIWVETGPRDISGLVGVVFDKLPPDTAVLVEAGNLRKGTPLRALFETRADAASIECYPATSAGLGQTIDTLAKAANVRLDAEARARLVLLLSEQPAGARGEIEKLMLFAGEGGELRPADIDALVSGGGASPGDALVDCALAGDLKGLERAAMLTLDDPGEAALAALRLAARVALLLEIRQGGAPPERLNRLPFTVRDAILAQANAYAPEALMRRLPSLLNLLVSARRAPELSGAAALRALTAFALAARRARE